MASVRNEDGAIVMTPGSPTGGVRMPKLIVDLSTNASNAPPTLEMSIDDAGDVHVNTTRKLILNGNDMGKMASDVNFLMAEYQQLRSEVDDLRSRHHVIATDPIRFGEGEWQNLNGTEQLPSGTYVFYVLALGRISGGGTRSDYTIASDPFPWYSGVALDGGWCEPVSSTGCLKYSDINVRVGAPRRMSNGAVDLWSFRVMNANGKNSTFQFSFVDTSAALRTWGHAGGAGRSLTFHFTRLAGPDGREGNPNWV